LSRYFICHPLQFAPMVGYRVWPRIAFTPHKWISTLSKVNAQTASCALKISRD